MSSKLEEIMIKFFGKWDEKTEKKPKIFFLLRGLFLVEVCQRSVFTYNQSRILDVFNSISGVKSLDRLYVSAAVALTSKKRGADCRDFFILRPTDSKTLVYEIVGYLFLEKGREIVYSPLRSLEQTQTPPHNTLFVHTDDLFTDLITWSVARFTEDPKPPKEFPETHSLTDKYLSDFGNSLWFGMCQSIGLEPHEESMRAESFALLLKKTTMAASNKRLSEEPFIRQFFPFFCEGGMSSHVSRRKWDRFIRLFTHSLLFSLALPVIDFDLLQYLMSQDWFHHSLTRSGSEALLRKYEDCCFLLRIPEDYWQFGCFALSCKCGEEVQHHFIAWHIPQDPQIYILDGCDTPLSRSYKDQETENLDVTDTKNRENGFFYFVPLVEETNMQEPLRLSVFSSIQVLFKWLREERGLKPLPKTDGCEE